ncbi:MAG TPA: hypothetical protein VJW23_03480, partial [Propionibacteriaceae bacterium]|nr:hypothetical protein [Propionibacteriaceae bacterium]
SSCGTFWFAVWVCGSACLEQRHRFAADGAGVFLVPDSGGEERGTPLLKRLGCPIGAPAEPVLDVPNGLRWRVEVA